MNGMTFRAPLCILKHNTEIFVVDLRKLLKPLLRAIYAQSVIRTGPFRNKSQ